MKNYTDLYLGEGRCILAFLDFQDALFLNGDDFRRRHIDETKQSPENKGERKKRLEQKRLTPLTSRSSDECLNQVEERKKFNLKACCASSSMCFSGPFLSISLGTENIHSNIYLIGYQIRREMKYLLFKYKFCHIYTRHNLSMISGINDSG